MTKIFQPLFLSGPHGGGKTTLVEKLKRHSNIFTDNDFDIDFTVDFPSIASLSDFERSLLRLYHRFFIANYANILAKENPGKVILTNRTVYDSEAYIRAYKDLGWISEEQYNKLEKIIKNLTYRPRTIVLNPPVEVIIGRLEKRRVSATRTNRDRIFKNEDSDIFVGRLHSYFEDLRDQQNILYIEDNGDEEVDKIMSWLDR